MKRFFCKDPDPDEFDIFYNIAEFNSALYAYNKGEQMETNILFSVDNNHVYIFVTKKSTLNSH